MLYSSITLSVVGSSWEMVGLFTFIAEFHVLGHKLSATIGHNTFGSINLLVILSPMNCFMASVLWCLTAWATGHQVQKFMAVMINLWPELLAGIGPMTSMAHCLKGSPSIQGITDLLGVGLSKTSPKFCTGLEYPECLLTYLATTCKPSRRPLGFESGCVPCLYGNKGLFLSVETLVHTVPNFIIVAVYNIAIIYFEVNFWFY